MKLADVRTTTDLLAVLNECEYQPAIELDNQEIDCACRITSIELSPLDDTIDRLDVEIIHIGNMSPARFVPDTLAEVKAKMLSHWAVKDEAQCGVQNVIDTIQEGTGYRDTLWNWLEYHEAEERQRDRMAAAIDITFDRLREAI